MNLFKSCRALTIVAAIALSACVTQNERRLPLAEVTGWKIAEIKVDYLPTARVNLENRTTAIAMRKAGPDLYVAAPVDPSNPGRNLAQEKLIDISSQPDVIAEARSGAAGDIEQHFRRAFSTQPPGNRPIRLALEIMQVEDAGDQAILNVKSTFSDARSGQVLLVNEGVGHIRPSRRAQAVGAVIGGGLGGLIGVALVASVQDSGRPPPFQDVMEESAKLLRAWLLKPDTQN